MKSKMLKIIIPSIILASLSSFVSSRLITRITLVAFESLLHIKFLKSYSKGPKCTQEMPLMLQQCIKEWWLKSKNQLYVWQSVRGEGEKKGKWERGGEGMKEMLFWNYICTPFLFYFLHRTWTNFEVLWLSLLKIKSKQSELCHC